VGPTIFPQGPKFLSVPGPPNLYFNHCQSLHPVLRRGNLRYTESTQK